MAQNSCESCTYYTYDMTVGRHGTKITKVICAISIWMKMNICVLFQTSIISALIIGMGMSIWW